MKNPKFQSLLVSTAMLLSSRCEVAAFTGSLQHNRLLVGRYRNNNQWKTHPLNQAAKDNDELDLDQLKIELAAYLEKRKEVNADEAAKAQVGRVVGGTKGNPILEYVSGAPNKEFVIEEAPNIFDYDELVRK
jgi:hypothetical protein